MHYAFTNVPSNRPILQELVDDFCHTYNPAYDDETDIAAQESLPREFFLRVLRTVHSVRNSECTETTKRCYLEHAEDEEKSACGKSHMVFDTVRGHGYFQ
jgi:hypothetical protein